MAFNFNDPSWDSSWLSLYGWIYPSSWTKTDKELRNSLGTTFRSARSMVNKLGPQIGDMERLCADWKEMLDGYERTIKYWEAEAVLEELEYILDEAQQQVEADRLLIEANKKPALGTTKSKTGGSTDLNNDNVFTSAMLGYSKSTAKNPPSKIKPVCTPYSPPTPEQVWKSQQRQMATDCDNGIKFGTHPVNQGSVLGPLALGTSDGSVWQYRSGPENSHVRIMRTAANQFWTKGLSHDEERRAGRYMVYKRDGGSDRFTHVSGARHPDEQAASTV